MSRPASSSIERLLVLFVTVGVIGVVGVAPASRVVAASGSVSNISARSDSTAAERYLARNEKWRAQREARLRADGGWLTVAGLYWLEEGANRFGTGEDNTIRLPEGSAPSECGSFEYHDGRVRLQASVDAGITIDGQAATAQDLENDTSERPDVMKLGRLTMTVIQRGDRVGIRLKDLESPYRKQFTGLSWYPVDEEYRVEGKWVPYDPPKKLAITNVLGQTDEQICPGYVVFSIDHQDEGRLEPILESPDSKELFFVFADGTTAETTYPGGRFLYTELPVDGKLLLDFNQAYNPPCAFTPYATCPLPPEVNYLKVRIEAGEQNYGEHYAAPVKHEGN